MHYLFIYPNAANIGGVQTLIARIAEGLLDEGHTVSVLFFGDISNAVTEIMPDQCKCLNLSETCIGQFFYPLNCRDWLVRHCKDIDICVTFGSKAMHFVTANLSSFANQPVVISYIVNDDEYIRSKKKLLNRFSPYIFFEKYFRDKFPNTNKYYMSEAILRIHEESMSTRFPGARITPLPIKPPVYPCDPALRPFRLVSIGRIDSNMKTYNFMVPPIIRELRNQGLNIHWDIYGGGPNTETEKLMAVIKDNNLEECIKWHGEIPYYNMKAVLENASAFLGMGTAAIEAAMHNIPSIVAVAFSSDPVCYGFLQDIPFGSCGEGGAYWIERRSIKSVLFSIYHASQSDYKRLVVLGKTSAMQYEYKTLILRFIELSKESKKASVPDFPISWSLILCILLFFRRLFRRRRI